MPGVPRGVLRGGTEAAQQAVPDVQRPTPGAPQRSQRGGLPSSRAAAGVPIVPRREAFERIFAFAQSSGEGARFGALGLPRYGKTTLIDAVIDEALARGVARWAFIHDVKKPEPQYAGTVRASVDAFRAKPPGPGESRRIVFHAPPMSGVPKPDPEAIAQAAFALARAGQPTLVHVDELLHAVKQNSQIWTAPTLGELVREGSSNGVSFCYTTQFPQRVPTEALDMVECTAVFNLQGRPADYAASHLDIPLDVVRTLPPWHFVLVSIYDGWGGVIYGP